MSMIRSEHFGHQGFKLREKLPSTLLNEPAEPSWEIVNFNNEGDGIPVPLEKYVSLKLSPEWASCFDPPIPPAVITPPLAESKTVALIALSPLFLDIREI